jgi:hypothetical protein
MNNKSYITNILLAIIPLLLVVGYFERYLNLLPQYFVSQTVFADNELTSQKPLNIQLQELDHIPTTIIDEISNLAVPSWKVSRVYTYLAGRGAPLASEAKYLVQAAAYYKIDYRLVASISIIESSGGLHTYRPYNAWGWGGADNAFVFKSWKDSITTVTRGLSRYYASGAVTPAQIAPRYNPHTPNEWSRKVSYVMEQM